MGPSLLLIRLLLLHTYEERRETETFVNKAYFLASNNLPSFLYSLL